MPYLSWRGKSDHCLSTEKVERVESSKLTALEHGDSFVIQGDDDLGIMKTLLCKFSGKVQCVISDLTVANPDIPSFSPEHEITAALNYFHPRFELLRDMLAVSGSLWMICSPKSVHYIKVMMDEVFGAQNYVDMVTFQQNMEGGNHKFFSPSVGTILVYAKLKQAMTFTKELNKDKRGRRQVVKSLTFLERVSPIFLRKRKKLNYSEKACNEQTKAVPNLWLKEEIKSMQDTPESTSEIDEVRNDSAAGICNKVIRLTTANSDYVMDSFVGTGMTISAACGIGRKYIGIKKPNIASRANIGDYSSEDKRFFVKI